MSRKHLKLVAAGAVLSIAVSLLAFAGLRDGWVYFLHVDQFTQGDTYRMQRVRLHGVVGAENLQVSNAGLLASFYLEGDSSRLRVEYSGVIPDMFRAGHEVVVEGRLNESGTFIADTLMTKCGSRYESDGEQPPEGHPAVSGEMANGE
jgi:cytochrome c-type biogenesis protein CcmE